MNPFLGASKDRKNSRILISGIPFDGTSSFRAGSRFAPASIREASQSIETYSVYQDRCLDDFKFFDAGDIDISPGDTKRAVKKVFRFARKNSDKILVSLGGEHLVTLGLVQALHERYKDMILVCLDAHTDLRDNYLGIKLSHATVLRRIVDMGLKVVLLGARSGTKEEFEFARKNNILHSFDDFKKMDYIIKGKKIYVSIDMDVFDPGFVPGVSNPEAGGINFIDFMKWLKEFPFQSVIGVDVVEINPGCDPSFISSVFAAKLLREILIRLSYQIKT
ncbi:MAG: agmatinase [Spirochaetes bacterium]|nr:agmatinase [Spirochaetota bacterium]